MEIGSDSGSTSSSVSYSEASLLSLGSSYEESESLVLSAPSNWAILDTVLDTVIFTGFLFGTQWGADRVLTPLNSFPSCHLEGRTCFEF